MRVFRKTEEQDILLDKLLLTLVHNRGMGVIVCP